MPDKLCVNRMLPVTFCMSLTGSSMVGTERRGTYQSVNLHQPTLALARYHSAKSIALQLGDSDEFVVVE
ncbi:unnamed protein product [Peniophora sp. CBMAI 1063]|nr:unnamed protein product [Peniophora sp. CBMAI 1063]